MSFLHGIVSLVFSSYLMFYLPLTCGETNTSLEIFLVSNSCGYFLYDFIAMAYFKLLDKAMCFHHFICITGMWIALASGISGNYISAGIFISEVSNPFMHARIILKHFELRYTKAYEFSEICYIILFIFGRIIIGTGVVLRTITCSENNLFVRLTCLGLAF
mgnify:CR=1 FL=1